MQVNADQKVALITGGARRIGAAIVEHLHAAGFNVGIHYNNSKSQAEQLANQLNQQRAQSALTLQADLRHQRLVEQLPNMLLDYFGRLDVVVNNASVFIRDPHGFDDSFLINVQAPYWLSLSAFSYLSLTKGCIINITDVHAETPLKDYSIYC